MRFLSTFVLALLLTLSARAQVPPKKALATMQAAAGFQVELIAAEPMVLNPTSVDVDHKGRVRIAAAVNYRRVAFNRPILRPEGDRIAVLIDEKEERKECKAVTFKNGVNAVLLKVANGNNPHGFYFTLLSKEEVKATGTK